MNKIKFGNVVDCIITSIWTAIGAFCSARAAMTNSMDAVFIYFAVAVASFYFMSHCLSKTIHKNVERDYFFEDDLTKYP